MVTQGVCFIKKIYFRTNVSECKCSNMPPDCLFKCLLTWNLILQWFSVLFQFVQCTVTSSRNLFHVQCQLGGYVFIIAVAISAKRNYKIRRISVYNCPASRTTLVARRFRVAAICPIIQVPHCIRVFFYFVWFVFINHIFQFYYELCTYCNILDIYLS